MIFASSLGFRLAFEATTFEFGRVSPGSLPARALASRRRDVRGGDDEREAEGTGQ